MRERYQLIYEDDGTHSIGVLHGQNKIRIIARCDSGIGWAKHLKMSLNVADRWFGDIEHLLESGE